MELVSKAVVISGEKLIIRLFPLHIEHDYELNKLILCSQAIMYSCLTIVNIFVPGIISIFGPIVSMFLGATAYL